MNIHNTIKVSIWAAMHSSGVAGLSLGEEIYRELEREREREREYTPQDFKQASYKTIVLSMHMIM